MAAVFAPFMAVPFNLKPQLDVLASATPVVSGKARRRGLPSREEEQRRMTRRALCWSARSALTQWAGVEKDSKASYYAVFHKLASSQLRFLGSIT
ncbi:MAG: hypothetical protein FWC42_03595 [Proteobacteria bacterium]|nr:hypothetical protein [Pseudomonadota bacterium]